MPRSKYTAYAKLVTATAALGGATYGYYTAVIAETFAQPGWYSAFGLAFAAGEPGYAHTTEVQATVNGLLFGAGAVGALSVMYVAEKWGRKGALQIGALIGCLGGALQAGANNLETFYAGRFFSGLCIGMMAAVTPMYLSELSKPDRRGFTVGLYGIAENIGSSVPAWIGIGTYFATDTLPSFAWRFPLAIQCLIPLALLIASIWIPESPRWLIKKGRNEKAWTALQRLHGSQDMFVREEFYQMTEQLKLEALEKEAMGGNVWKACFTRPSYRKRMILGFLMPFGTELIGILVLNNYATILFTNLGETGFISLVLLLVWVSISIPLIIFGCWLHDRLNSRRTMFFIGTTGCLVSTIILTALTAQFQGTTNKTGLDFAILMLFIYPCFFDCFNNATMYIYVSEIFPFSIRTIGMGFAFLGQYSGSLIMTQTAPIGIAAVGWKYYLLLIFWMTFFLIVFYFYFPETAKLSLEELSAVFGDKVAVNITDAAGASEDSRRQLYEMIQRMEKTTTNPEAAGEISDRSIHNGNLEKN